MRSAQHIGFIIYELVNSYNAAMSLKLTVHNGADEIGGSCIELLADNTKIVLDAGRPLAKDGIPAKLNKIKPNAIVISHPHMDHYGLIENDKSDAEIYIGETGLNLINAARLFCKKTKIRGNFKFFERSKVFHIGPFKITPYLMDHSAVDAYSFLIETKYGNVFYSGDFRGHGRKKVLLDILEKDPPKNIDFLFMEGTMLGRPTNEDVPTEDEVKDKITGILEKQKNCSFLFSSSQNIDRIVSAYDACLITGKIFVIDTYTAWILENIKKISSRVPTIDWDFVRVLFFKQHCDALFSGPFPKSFISRTIKKRIQPQEIKENPDKYLVQLSTGLTKFVYGFKSDTNKPNMIYSQWLGYLEGDEYKKQYGGIRKLIDEGVVNFYYAHTSGHATVTDLKRLVDAIKPKHLVPIHTECPDAYSDIFKNVLKIKNNDSVIIGA